MKGKKLSLLLAGCLGLTLLAGCGKSGSNPAEALKERYAQYVDLGDYKQIQYTPTETKITSEQVDSRVQQLVTQNGKKVEKKTGMALKGDTVNIDYVGTIDGVEFEGGNTKGAGTTITLGSSGYVDNFDDQVASHSPGETFDVKVTFPENYHQADLAGKPAVFKTTLNFIETTEYPELTDALVSEKTEYKTVEEYRQATEAQMVKDQAEKDIETDKEAMMTQMMETSAVKQYPQAELEERTDQLVAQIQTAASQYGMKLDQYLMAFGYDADGFQKEIRDSVEKYMKRKMIVAAIAAKEDINVSKEEADAKIQELLKATGLTDVNDLNTRTGYTDEDYYYIILEEKVVDYIYNDGVPRTKDSGETVIVDDKSSEGTTTEGTSEESVSTEAATEGASGETASTEAN